MGCPVMFDADELSFKSPADDPPSAGGHLALAPTAGNQQP